MMYECIMNKCIIYKCIMYKYIMNKWIMNKCIMYKWIMYKCIMYKCIVTKCILYKCMMYKIIMYNCTNAKMYKCTNVYFGQTGRFFSYPRVPPCRAKFLSIHLWIKFLYTNYGEKHLRINSRPSRLPSGAHFPSVLKLFKTALVSIIFILELSVLDKSCLELNFQFKRIISRVPCTAVFLRSCTSGFQYWIFYLFKYSS